MSNKVIPISDFGEIVTGKTPSSNNPEDFGDETLFITPSDDFDHKYISTTARFLSSDGVEKLKSKLLPPESVLVTCIGSDMGKLAMNALPAITNQQINSIVVDKSKYDPSYVYYKLKKSYEVLRQYSTGSTAIPLLNKTDFSNIEITVEDNLSTQQKIAAVLTALDAKIELNQRINAELESMAKTLYDYWFVQFDFPNEKGKPYKSAGGKMVWNEKLGKEIPEGWDVKLLGKALKTNLGGTPSTKNPEYWENATIPWLNSGDLTEFPIIKSSSFVTKKGVDNSATTILPKGSVVVSLVRYIRPSIIALEACANQSVVGIRETEALKNAFIYPYLVNEVPRLMSLRTGAQQPHINKETIDDSPLCTPPANVLKEYYKVGEPIYKKIINVAFESQTLTELRDWLLPMLMNGQVRVS